MNVTMDSETTHRHKMVAIKNLWIKLNSKRSDGRIIFPCSQFHVLAITP